MLSNIKMSSKKISSQGKSSLKISEKSLKYEYN